MTRLGDWLLDRLPWVLGVGFVACVALYGWLYSVERREWEAFAAAHACRVVGQREGGARTGWAFTGGKSGGGVVVVNEPGQTAYLCDDGITYWRDR